MIYSIYNLDGKKEVKWKTLKKERRKLPFNLKAQLAINANKSFLIAWKFMRILRAKKKGFNEIIKYWNLQFKFNYSKKKVLSFQLVKSMIISIAFAVKLIAIYGNSINFPEKILQLKSQTNRLGLKSFQLKKKIIQIKPMLGKFI